MVGGSFVRSIVRSLDRPGAARAARAGVGAGAQCARCGAGVGRVGGAGLSPGRSGGGGSLAGALPARLSAGWTGWWLRTLPLPSPRRLARDRCGAGALPLPPLPSPFPGPAVWAPRPRALPPRLAFPPLRKGPGASPRGHGPSTGQGAAGRGAGLRARIPLGSGTSCTAQGAGGAAGGGHSAAATAPPPSSPVPPQKNAAAATKPIAVCITSCLLLFLPAPAHPPAAGTGALCASLGWKRPSSCTGGSGREEPNLPSPQGLRGKSSCPSRPMEERRWAGKAGRGARAPSRLNDEDVVWLPAGEGGREGKRGRTAAVGGCWPGRAPVAPAGCEPPAPPAGRCPPERIPSSAGTR